MVVAHPHARSRRPRLAASVVPPHPAGQSALYILSKKRNTPLGGAARGKKWGGRVARTSPPNLPVPRVLCFHDHDEDAPRWVASRSPPRAPHECHPQAPQAGRAWGLSRRGTSTAGVPRVSPFGMANRCVHVDGTPPPPPPSGKPAAGCIYPDMYVRGGVGGRRAGLGALVFFCVEALPRGWRAVPHSRRYSTDHRHGRETPEDTKYGPGAPLRSSRVHGESVGGQHPGSAAPPESTSRRRAGHPPHRARMLDLQVGLSVCMYSAASRRCACMCTVIGPPVAPRGGLASASPPSAPVAGSIPLPPPRAARMEGDQPAGGGWGEPRAAGAGG